MADYTRTTETSERIVIRIDTPTNVVELSKASSAAYKAAQEIAEKDNGHLYDDAVTVESDEEEIRFIVVTKDWRKSA